MQRKRPERPTGASGAGFVRLFRKERRHVMGKLRRCGVTNSADVEDLAQFVFEIYLRQEEPPLVPRAWLLATARQVAFNWRRLWRNRFEIPTENLDPAVFDGVLADDIVKVSQWCERAESLPDRERDALRLDLQGYSLAGIAEETGSIVSTSWARLKRAWEKLERMEKQRVKKK